jgi:hypothetical protein
MRLPEKPPSFALKASDGHVVVLVADLVAYAVTSSSSRSDSICAGAGKGVDNHISSKAEHPH